MRPVLCYFLFRPFPNPISCYNSFSQRRAEGVDPSSHYRMYRLVQVAVVNGHLVFFSLIGFGGYNTRIIEAVPLYHTCYSTVVCCSDTRGGDNGIGQHTVNRQ